MDDRGAAALEFALALPVLCLCYFGCVEIAKAIAINRMTTLAAAAVTSIASQYTAISASQTMPDILNAAATVMTPYPIANAIVTVSSVSIDANGAATVAWSQALNGSGRAAGSSVAVPQLLDTPNSSLILGEINYTYTAGLDYLGLGTLHFTSSLFMAPRNSAAVALTP